MKKILYVSLFLLLQAVAVGQDRFPKPDFESGYQYPEVHYHVPNTTL